ncbi:MAG: histidinol phosphatase [Verrucomicrobia bacterium]|nr:histidinol phosphatase [Verrucomicrobiota bacterium]
MAHRIAAAVGASIALALLNSASLRGAEPGRAPARQRSNVERLALAHLRAAHEDAERLRSRRASPPPMAGLHDHRCILHAHAEDSAHTGGTLPEMLADAKRAGVSAILLADHFRPPRDFIDGRWRGLKEGVLFIPGSEVRGFDIHPMVSILDKMQLPTPDFVTAVAGGEGLIFLSHIEERPDHSLEGLTGLEIYNRHWDAKRDPGSLIALAMKLTDPEGLAELQEAVRLYPDETLAFQCDYPQIYLEKWDSGTRTRRLTGIAANDCHHNQVFVMKMVDAETVALGTIVDKDSDLKQFKALLRPGIRQLTKGHQPGDLLAKVDMDPYYRSFRNVSTHVLAAELDEASVRAALKAGRAFVAHDWMCDATGFRFEALTAGGERVGLMGDEVKWVPGLKLKASLPVPALIRLLRHGEEVARSEGRELFEFPLAEAGAYRLEAWLQLDGEQRPWVFSNPVYVR